MGRLFVPRGGLSRKLRREKPRVMASRHADRFDVVGRGRDRAAMCKYRFEIIHAETKSPLIAKRRLQDDP